MSRVTDLIENNRWVYWVDPLSPQPSDESTPPRYRVSIVVENESGHFPTGGDDVAPWYWDYETCRAKNAALGYSREEEFKIIGSSFATAATTQNYKVKK